MPFKEVFILMNVQCVHARGVFQLSTNLTQATFFLEAW